MRARPLSIGLAALVGTLLFAATDAHASGPLLASGSLPEDMSVFWTAPFALLLLSIAIVPLIAGHWWHKNTNRVKVAVLFGAPVLIYLLMHGRTKLGHAAEEYVSFIALLGSLFVISGGIVIRGDILAKPMNNTLILALGGVLANLIGTTGASMLLIRLILRVNSDRKNTMHTLVFFIFMVSNVGGCLTPLGDPPLFLGFLRGVPFEWTLQLWPEWLFMLGSLLVVYFVFDTIQYRKESESSRTMDLAHVKPIRIDGLENFVYLGGVLAAVLFLPMWLREGAMLGVTGLSIWRTPKSLREDNGFNYEPIVEVATLFAGIFVTMVPALHLLEKNGGELGLSEPWHFFVATGFLSAFLDNAPTYLTFLAIAKTLVGNYAPDALLQLNDGAVPVALLIPISLGSVFMGAMTYIGNGPNFMVKAIAESTGQKMPSFFGYFGWAMAFLGPLLVAVIFLFLL